MSSNMDIREMGYGWLTLSLRKGTVGDRQISILFSCSLCEIMNVLILSYYTRNRNCEVGGQESSASQVLFVLFVISKKNAIYKVVETWS